MKTSLWEDGSKIKVIALKAELPEADSTSQEFMSKSAIDAKKYWLGELFKGAVTTTPKTADSVSELLLAVSSTPGAIAILPSNVAFDHSTSLKVISFSAHPKKDSPESHSNP